LPIKLLSSKGGQHLRIEAVQALPYNGKQGLPIFIIREDAFAPVATRGRAVYRTPKLNAQRTGLSTKLTTEYSLTP